MARATYSSGYAEQAAGDAIAKTLTGGFGDTAPRPDYLSKPINEGQVTQRVNAITSQKSPTMQLAAARGMQVAGRRGLQNSSIAAGTAQKAVIDAALPMAMGDVEDVRTRSLAQDELNSRYDLTKLNNANSIEVANIGAGATLGAASLRAQTDLKLADINNRHDLTMQEKDQLARIELAKLGFSHETGLAEMDRNTRLEIADKDINARASESALDRQFTAGENELTRGFQSSENQLTRAAQADQASLDRALQSDLTDREIAARFGLSLQEIGFRREELDARNLNAQLDRDLQSDLTDKEIASRYGLKEEDVKWEREKLDATIAANQQSQVAQIVADTNNARMNATVNTLNNPDIPASARAAAQTSINQQAQQTINYAQNLYGVSLDDRTPTEVQTSRNQTDPNLPPGNTGVVSTQADGQKRVETADGTYYLQKPGSTEWQKWQGNTFLGNWAPPQSGSSQRGLTDADRAQAANIRNDINANTSLTPAEREAQLAELDRKLAIIAAGG